MLKEVLVPSLGHKVKFVHREAMKKRAEAHSRSFHAPKSGLPAVTLPVDNSGGQAVSCPMDGNDEYGDCGPAMCAHEVNVWTFGQGKPGFTEWSVNTTALINQYLKVSGGDNGTDEDMLVGKNGIFMTGIAGDPTAIVVDSLDIDVTNTALAQFALDNGFLISLGWSVPDDFIQGFSTGSKWLKPDRPDPENGHYTPLVDVDASGNYSLWTWGTYCWVSPSFVASVQPQCFIAFSPRQFSTATGLDPKGRHITAQAALWAECGGNPIPASVIAAFPPVSAPVVNPPTPPTPTPPVNPPTPTPTPISSSTVVAIDFAAMTVSLPAGLAYGLTKGSSVRVYPTNSNGAIVFVPQEFTVVTSPSPANPPVKPSAINILALIQALAAAIPTILPIIEQIITAFTPASANRLKRDTSPVNPAPATLDDVLSNADVYSGLVAYVQALGITDPTILGPIQAAEQALLVQGVADLQAYATSKGLSAPQVVSHASLNYEVDSSQSPPALASIVAIPASSVPVIASSS